MFEIKFNKKIFRTFWMKFLLSFLATFLVLGGVLLGLYTYVFGSLNVDEDLTQEEVGIQAQDYHSKSIVNIALFGIDTTDSGMEGRSDSIIVVTLDHKK